MKRREAWKKYGGQIAHAMTCIVYDTWVEQEEKYDEEGEYYYLGDIHEISDYKEFNNPKPVKGSRMTTICGRCDIDALISDIVGAHVCFWACAQPMFNPNRWYTIHVDIPSGTFGVSPTNQ